jgi:pimeloyl-ACP methyl ester carboxylesterase
MPRDVRLPLLLAALLAFFLGLPTARAVSTAEESHLAEDLAAAPQSGETVWLDAAGTRFLALFNETLWPARRGGVLILHDADDHPDRRPLPHALRQELPRRGWAVLALQLPPGDSGTADVVSARLRAGLAWLEERNIAPVALVGQGMGAQWAAQFLAGRKETEPRALALLEPPDAEAPPLLDALGQLRLPVADIHRVVGAEVSPAVTRRATASRLNVNYRQSAVYDARQRMEDVEPLIVNRVSGWLSKVLQAASPGPSAPPPKR